MKKITALILALSLILSLTGCIKSSSDNPQQDLPVQNNEISSHPSKSESSSSSEENTSTPEQMTEPSAPTLKPTTIPSSKPSGTSSVKPSASQSSSSQSSSSSTPTPKPEPAPTPDPTPTPEPTPDSLQIEDIYGIYKYSNPLASQSRSANPGYDLVDATMAITDGAIWQEGFIYGSVAGFGYTYTVQSIENTRFTLALESENGYGINKEPATGTVVFDVDDEQKILTVVSFNIVGMSGMDLDAAREWLAPDIRYIRTSEAVAQNEIYGEYTAECFIISSTDQSITEESSLVTLQISADRIRVSSMCDNEYYTKEWNYSVSGYLPTSKKELYVNNNAQSGWITVEYNKTGTLTIISRDDTFSIVGFHDWFASGTVYTKVSA